MVLICSSNPATVIGLVIVISVIECLYFCEQKPGQSNTNGPSVCRNLQPRAEVLASSWRPSSSLLRSFLHVIYVLSSGAQTEAW
ncbi:unnamed protein product [Protopolystoma xenopodis]|uniref:Uncharacterized protein n=1 Tax=Protopolystoma xenopodis TaxID=117903 RepID=A0A3S5A859_9PLAT|nr:unnamed protein product [Protopolystoma xenopodis]